MWVMNYIMLFVIEKPGAPRGYTPQCGRPDSSGGNMDEGVNSNGFYHRQCGGDYCWCVDGWGKRIEQTLTPADHCLICDKNGILYHLVSFNAINAVYCARTILSYIIYSPKIVVFTNL